MKIRLNETGQNVGHLYLFAAANKYGYIQKNGQTQAFDEIEYSKKIIPLQSKVKKRLWKRW